MRFGNLDIDPELLKIFTHPFFLEFYILFLIEHFKEHCKTQYFPKSEWLYSKYKDKRKHVYFTNS